MDDFDSKISDFIQGIDPKDQEQSERLISELQAYKEELSAQTEEFRQQQKELGGLHLDLEQTRQEYQDLYELAPVGYFTFDSHSILLKVNKSGADLLGVATRMVESHPILSFIDPDHRSRFYIHHRTALESGKQQACEMKLTKKDGSVVYVQVQTKSAQTKSDEVQLLSVFTDITERKRAEEELKVSKELAQIRANQLQALAIELIEAEERERQRIADLLHDDLQQILASAKMQLQATSGENKDLKRVADLLKESIAKTRKLSHQLNPLVKYHSDLNDLLNWLMQHIKEQFGLEVDLQVQTQLLLGKESIKTFIYRSLTELMFNVSKHAGVKSVKVVADRLGNLLNIAVSDDGKGFDVSLLDEMTDGKGIGLLRIKERAAFLGGGLSIDSASGKGSRFILQIPISDGDIRIGDANHQQPLPSIATDAVSEPETVRILFVDDHKMMRKGLIQLLTGHPGIVKTGEADTGKKAVKLVQQLDPKPHLVLMDISMPIMDGIEATRQIKTLWPEVRVIGLSMHDDEVLANSMRQAGAETLLSKSSSPDKLLKAIYGTKVDKIKTYQA